MPNSQTKTLDDFLQLQNRNALSHAVRAGNQLGIFEALTVGQKTTQQIATELNLRPAPLRRLMNVLVQTELIDQYGDDFALSTIGRLIPLPYLDFGDRYWEQLTGHMRADDSSTTANELDFLNHKASEEWMLTPIALDATQALDIGKSRRGLRILEIGAGSAVFAATMAHRDPDSVINLLDTPANLERSRKTIDSVGLERQTVMIAAPNLDDLSAIDELHDQTFDLIVLAGIIHRFSPAQCTALFSQLQLLVKAERELAIIDVFPGQESGDVNRAIFELELGLRTSAGQLHDPTDLKSWLTAAGFGHMQFAHLPSPPHYWGLLVAEKG